MGQNLEASLIRLLDKNGETKGTGFLVSENIAVTCAHVVEACGSVPGSDVQCVFHKTNERYYALVLGNLWRETEDIAVLQFHDNLPESLASIRFGETLGIDGHACLTLGYPQVGSMQGTNGRGEIFGIVRENNGRQLLQLRSQEITVGFSGAPLLDTETNRVVGMVTEIATADHYGKGGETAFATPVEVLFEVLHSFDANLVTHPPQAIEEYLADLLNYCANLPYLSLHDIRPSKSLDEVYVPLKARPQLRKDGNGEGHETRETLSHESWSIAEVMRHQEQPHVLIVGEPGAGKSTLLRQMAEHAWEEPEMIGLNQPHLPLLVPLRRLAESEGSFEERLNRAITSELTLNQELERGFFSAWQSQTGRPWLILLDALDEVPGDKRAPLMQWLKALLKREEFHRIVITTRPSGYLSDEFDGRSVGHYDLLPFELEQIDEFSKQWFGKGAGAFLQQLEYMHIGDLSRTPLLLTIAAKVYLEKQVLPERRATLYEEFVEIWLQEAEQHGLKDALGQDLYDVARWVLERIALIMTERPGVKSLIELSNIACSELQNLFAWPEPVARARSKRFVDSMTRRSGVFIRRGETGDWVHPTFREYLSAIMLVKDSNGNLVHL